jgi:hypothetical protein
MREGWYDVMKIWILHNPSWCQCATLVPATLFPLQQSPSNLPANRAILIHYRPKPIPELSGMVLCQAVVSSVSLSVPLSHEKDSHFWFCTGKQ